MNAFREILSFKELEMRDSMRISPSFLCWRATFGLIISEKTSPKILTKKLNLEHFLNCSFPLQKEEGY